MSHESLALLWFVLLGILLAGYAILDGFDFGVGILHPFAKGDEERRTMLNSIGPLWDGNEVWLVTFGGGLFAAFPVAYATVFSAFYNAFMLLLFCLIFRAVSIEFRSKVQSRLWRRIWDAGFFLSSLTAAFLFGVAAGNVLSGMPIDGDLVYRGSFLGQLRPFTLLSGVLTTTLFAMHGAIYVYLKTEGDLHRRAKGWMWKTFFAFLAAFLVTTAYAVAFVPKASDQLWTHWWLWSIPAINALAIANIPRAIYQGRPGDAFLSSSFAILAFAALFSVEIFPSLIESSLNPAYDITIYNASSSPSTLALMAVIAAIGLPFVLCYTVTIYWLFRGKVRLDSSSY